VKAGYIHITSWQLLLAGSLLLVNIVLSGLLRLGLTQKILWAAIRMITQLLLIGWVLNWIFSLSHPVPVLGIGVLMATIAARVASRQSRRQYIMMFWNCLLAILCSSFLVTCLAMIGILRVDPWFSPQYFIPLLGMVLGNALNGVSLGVERLLEGIVLRRHMVEGLLALGATRWEATSAELRSAFRAAMLPVLNSMMIIGLVSFPGMMTGQILAGAAPLDAVRYQIVVMCLIASGTALGTITILLLTCNALFDDRERLRLERLHDTQAQD
tara:strand:+ start:4047 stop:4856 length:810 start_codon:yes stop_codon:yes gene_type:complete